MSTLKKLLLATGIIVVAIQFIQPGLNKNGQTSGPDISSVLNVPDSVRVIIHNSCYDCHSNSTNYPWYSYIQPVGWLLANDIKRGKINMNFSEFAQYPERRQISKLDEIADNVTDGSMPLKIYTMMHKKARLDKNEKELLINWTQHAKAGLPPEK